MRRKLLLSAMAAATAIITFCGGLRPADAQQPQKPNILFIMGDDIGWMQPSIYHQGLMVGETPNIDKIGTRARSSPTTTRSRVARPGGMPSSPACIRCAPA